MKSIIQKISDYSLEEIMGDRFGRYCKEIIQDRALPDVRDGLKPVQRRILYGMYVGKNTYDKKYRKSAKAVGDIMGNYHPHGDSSIYDAMVRMSQDWKMMTPYIDMHGNNGSMDGDSAAAMRYTEARLSKISNELLKDIDKDTVMMVPNYDDTLLEPTVLPCGFPNLLVNGSTGISAGYATNIPTHNLAEVIDGTIIRIDKPNSTLEDIMEVVKGPDFPTGGIVEGKEQIKEAFKTGKGKIIIKSKYEIEKEKSKEQIVITEIPYEVNKALLVKKMNDIRIEKKIDGIADVRDETARGDLRIVIELKKDANKDLIINYLLKNTDMQVSYSYNMVAIVNRRPSLVGLIDILDAYIAHEKEVIIRRSKFDLEHAKARYHIVEGLMKAISILDDVIKTIRASKDKADATQNLIKEYDFTFNQADAIVKLQLYRLTNTDIIELEQELERLKELMDFLNSLLNDEKKLMKQLKKELLEVKKEYEAPRKTEIKDEITEIKIDTTSMIAKEDCIIVVSKSGYVKRVSLRSYSSSEDNTLLKEGDYIIGLYQMNTLDTLLLFTDLGNYLYVPVHEIPELKWKELGKHISNIINTSENEKIIYSLPVTNFEKKEQITLLTKNGMIKRTSLNEFKVTRYSKPLTCIKLKDDDKLIYVSNMDKEEIFISTYKGYGLRYNLDEVSVIGIKAAGVKAINLKDDYVVSASIFNENDEYLSVITTKNTGKRVRLTEFEKLLRARKGVLIIRDVKTNPYNILKTFIISSKQEICLQTKDDIKIIKLTELPILDRYSTGTSLSRKNIINVFIESKLQEETKEEIETIEIEEVEEKPNKKISLEDIDREILTIEDFLNNFDS